MPVTPKLTPGIYTDAPYTESDTLFYWFTETKECGFCGLKISLDETINKWEIKYEVLPVPKKLLKPDFDLSLEMVGLAMVPEPKAKEVKEIAQQEIQEQIQYYSHGLDFYVDIQNMLKCHDQ